MEETPEKEDVELSSDESTIDSDKNKVRHLQDRFKVLQSENGELKLLLQAVESRMGSMEGLLSQQVCTNRCERSEVQELQAELLKARLEKDEAAKETQALKAELEAQQQLLSEELDKRKSTQRDLIQKGRQICDLQTELAQSERMIFDLRAETRRLRCRACKPESKTNHEAEDLVHEGSKMAIAPASPGTMDINVSPPWTLQQTPLGATADAKRAGVQIADSSSTRLAGVTPRKFYTPQAVQTPKSANLLTQRDCRGRMPMDLGKSQPCLRTSLSPTQRERLLSTERAGSPAHSLSTGWVGVLATPRTSLQVSRAWQSPMQSYRTTLPRR
mmetsp:Transcript_20544/g.36950  ORF Transcript_20544/g.36950 Transcript_20544/m.36950 type:complete len:330 (+) Transcript_20544:32-1021(+)